MPAKAIRKKSDIDNRCSFPRFFPRPGWKTSAPFFERYPTGIDFDGSAVGQVVISESFQKPHLGGLRLAGTTTWPIYFPPSGRVKIPPLFFENHFHAVKRSSFCSSG
jgi:hypothetical protein